MDEPNPGGTSRRPYHSPARRRQAEQTRARILAAARDLFRSAGYATTTIEAIAQQVESRRRANQARLAAYLEERGLLRSNLALDEATDIIWALTSYDVYRALIGERRWPPDRYQAWLATTLAATLLSP